jgi:FkbM family methyltransferase
MFHSQEYQDQYLEANVFKCFKKGFFVDVGAYDGIHINNTLYFEEINKWNGINIEPNKRIYDALVVNRPKNINLNCAIFNEDGETEFLLNTGYTEMLSGIKNTFDSRHVRRLENENNIHGSTTESVNIITKRLETIFDEHDVSHVHYLSIDVEGAEFEVIQSINFDKVFIDVIAFENNYDDKSIPIVKYLEERDYVVIHRSIDIFMIHKKSMFHVSEQP